MQNIKIQITEKIHNSPLQDLFPWLTVPRGDPDMSNMAMVLLLLLAAATCTAAADMPAGVDISDIEERVGFLFLFYLFLFKKDTSENSSYPAMLS